jgi:hypothetical protein
LKLIGKAPSGALAVLALGVLIGACGSASSSSSTSTASTAANGGTGTASAGGGAAGANPARRAALTACLKQHGVTLPSRPAGAPPGGSGTGTGGGGTGTGTGTNGTGTTPGRRFFFGGGGFAANPKVRSALQACGAKFGFRGGAGARARLSHTVITKFVTCVRQHGYNLPNPNFSGKGPIFPASIQTNPKFQAASRACQNLLVPTRPPGGSSGGTSTTSGA